MTPFSPAALAPAPACPARPRRAHANALGPDPAGAEGCGVPGTCGPAPARQLGSAELERRGAPARSRAGRVHVQLPATRSPGEGKDGDLRVRSAESGPHPAPREAASGSPGCGVRGRSTTSTPAAQASPRPVSRGPWLTSERARTLCPGPGRGAGGPCDAEGGRRESRGRAARPAGWIPSLPQLRVASPTQGHSRPRSRPRPAAARPSVSLTRSTHPASAPRSSLHTRRRSRLPGFCIRLHARSDTDPVPPPALPSSFPTLLSRRIPYTASALCWLAPHQPPPLPLQTSTSPETAHCYPNTGHHPLEKQETRSSLPRKKNFAAPAPSAKARCFSRWKVVMLPGAEPSSKCKQR